MRIKIVRLFFRKLPNSQLWARIAHRVRFVMGMLCAGTRLDPCKVSAVRRGIRRGCVSPLEALGETSLALFGRATMFYPLEA
eukprot:SAG31_NODE_1147_length_9665_cov_10.571399_1_plen_82_part_00